MTLVIMAAGMGSRFGGLKQMEPMGPNGEFIIDYSVYDAIRAGFNKVVFVIKEEMFEDFKNTIGKRVEGHIEVEYAFQKMDDIPISKSFSRIKPWGTGHAILAARNLIDENFAIINADDFYGKNAFIKASEFLKNTDGNNFGMIGYRAVNTLTENGAVKRGVCELKNGKLSEIIESSLIQNGNKISCEALIDGKKFDIELDRLVSMNMLLFTPKLFEYLDKDFVSFLNNISDEEKEEFLIPEVVSNHIKNGDITVDVIETDSKWYGITYKEDKDGVKEAIVNLVKSGDYKESLWD